MDPAGPTRDPGRDRAVSLPRDGRWDKGPSRLGDRDVRGGQPAEASRRDLAEFERLGLRFGLLAPSSVAAWADDLVAKGGIPEPWLVDLALAGPDALDGALRRVPGEAQADLAMRLFLALLRRRWRSGRLTIGDVRRIGWLLHGESALPVPDGRGDWGVCLEVECEGFDLGWRTEDELRASIEEKLAEYSSLEPLLPVWA